MNKEKILEIKGLKKYYPLSKGNSIFLQNFIKDAKYVKAVDGISFDIFRGETFGLVGESGCGKSTTGKALVGLTDVTAGQILFNGREITEKKSRKNRQVRENIQIIFQDPFSSLNPRKKIGWLLEEPLRVHKKGTKQVIKRRVISMLEDVGFDVSYYHKYPHELSGGERQRIGILTALMLNPQLIIADEPVSALDVSVQSTILNLLKSLQKKYSLTYLFISHDLNVVYYMSDRIAVMYLGKIVELADVEKIYYQPWHPYTKSLISAIPNIYDEDNKLERTIIKGDIPSSTSPPSGCAFHTRCRECVARCKIERPEIIEIEKGHFVACHLYQ